MRKDIVSELTSLIHLSQYGRSSPALTLLWLWKKALAGLLDKEFTVIFDVFQDNDLFSNAQVVSQTVLNIKPFTDLRDSPTQQALVVYILAR